MRRLLGRMLGAATGLVLLAGTAFAGLVWLTLPPSSGTGRIPGLSAPAEVTFDADGIPRIHAATASDAAAVLGYLHARDRLGQMDLMRRAASGRLSELAGGSTLRLDRLMRTLGLRARAEADLAAATPVFRARLEAYARGVNALLAERGRFASPETAAFGPAEPWTPVDSVLWGKTMALYLSGNWRTELARAAVRDVPAGLLDWPSQSATLPPEASAAASRLATLLPRFPDPFTLPSTASNEWAVDGRHSATGRPLLAGDPHLAYGLPGIWYLARIDTPEGTLVGATAPGVPLVVIGHNGRIAWTFTTTGADTQDVFVETGLPDGQYATPEGPRPFLTREERIRVRGAADEVLTVRETRHGPVVSDLDAPDGPILAVSMAALDGIDTAGDGVLALNAATDLAGAGRAAALVSAPVQNLLVAAPDGIAQFTTGRVPLRRAGDGSLPVSGADGAHDWTGYAAGDALPHVMRPASGRIVNANERIAPVDFPVFLGRDWFGDWRARRIRALLDEGGDAETPARFAAMQTDAVSLFARGLLPRLLATEAEGQAARALQLLAHWDGTMAIDLPQPLLFNAWMQRFGAGLLDHARVPPAAAIPHMELIALALSPEGAAWCPDGCRTLLAETLRASTVALSASFGTDPAKWRWGDTHQAVFAPPLLGQVPVIGPLLSARIAQPGDDATVFRGGLRDGTFDSVHGPGFRGVYDLADLDRSLFAATSGQSGNPFSTHAADLMRRWQEGRGITIGAVPATIAGRLRLEP